jgi:hypothetical protein
MNAQRARHREAERHGRAAQHRRDRRRGAAAAALAVVLVAGIGGLAVSVAGRSGQAATGPSALPGLQTGPAPWSADTADLAARLRAIGLPPLSPAEGTALHIHQHLDLYVDGGKVPVPAGIGIDPAVGFAPLHTHDASGVIHVESPTVRSYTLGQFFAVWGVRLTPSCLGGYCAAGGGKRLRVYVNGTAYEGDPHHPAPGVPSGARGRLRHGRPAALPDPVHLPVPARLVAAHATAAGMGMPDRLG